VIRPCLRITASTLGRGSYRAAPAGAPPATDPGGEETRESHFLIAKQAGLGPADVKRIEVRGLRIADVRTPFRSPARPQPPPPSLAFPDGPLG
jgi:hypothetical protein